MFPPMLGHPVKGDSVLMTACCPTCLLGVPGCGCRGVVVGLVKGHIMNGNMILSYHVIQIETLMLAHPCLLML